MALTLEPKTYQYKPQASITGIFPTVGFESELTYAGSSSIIDVTLKLTVAGTLNIYQSPSQSDTDRIIVFSKVISAGEYFFKRFSIKGMFYSVEVLNTNSVEGRISLVTAAVLHTQFASSTFLNSRIGIDADTSLMRVGNDWNVDMVRGIHNSFEKVNIKGLLESSNPNTERTVGLQDYNFVVSSATNLYIYHPNANDDSAGTGARTVRIQYIDASDNLQSLDYTITGGGGLVHSLGIQGKAVHRIFVLTTGSLKQNAGQITITDASQTDIFNSIATGANTSQGAIYLVAVNQQLIIQDVNIAGTGMSGKIRIIERNYANGINYSLGDFKINSTYQQFTYTLNALINAGSMVMVNYIPDSGASAVDTLINVNINGVLCPLVDNF